MSSAAQSKDTSPGRASASIKRLLILSAYREPCHRGEDGN
jgi:hypothetical protein